MKLEFKNNQYLYTYQYKDHLGNVRLTYRDGYKNHATQENVKDGIIQVTEIIDQTDYYPFGLKHNNNALADYSAVNKYKYAYNGKELNDELGVDVYDFGARNYDPALGRWLNVDPLAENSRRWTPYNYAYNNPVYFIDPDGMQAVAGLKTDELEDIIKFMNDGSVERIQTDDEFDILTNEDGTLTKQIDFKDGKSQIGQIQEYETPSQTHQYMLIQDNEVARYVFEFAASTTVTKTSNAEFGLDMFDFEDGYSMNILVLGDQSGTGFPNVSPMGAAGSINLGENHFVRDANWIENNHSHPGIDPLNPSGFQRKSGSIFEAVGVPFGDRALMNQPIKPNAAYLYGHMKKLILNLIQKLQQ